MNFQAKTFLPQSSLFFLLKNCGLKHSKWKVKHEFNHNNNKQTQHFLLSLFLSFRMLNLYIFFSFFHSKLYSNIFILAILFFSRHFIFSIPPSILFEGVEVHPPTVGTFSVIHNSGETTPNLWQIYGYLPSLPFFPLPLSLYHIRKIVFSVLLCRKKRCRRFFSSLFFLFLFPPSPLCFFWFTQ